MCSNFNVFPVSAFEILGDKFSSDKNWCMLAIKRKMYRKWLYMGLSGKAFDLHSTCSDETYLPKGIRVGITESVTNKTV